VPTEESPHGEQVESSNLVKSEFYKFRFPVFRFPFSECKKLTLFICLAAVFLFDKSQRKTAARQAGGGAAPATPFWKTECGKQKTESLKICFFVNLKDSTR